MKAVQNERTTDVYRGRGNVLDLPCERVRPGVVRSFWQPSKEEVIKLFEGGVIELVILTEPIPPVSLNALTIPESNEDYEE